ncbi:MAG: hypothetical protein WB616_10910 [Candidatus Sulfotelmatobacter sp.]|jgi:hypothetical protein
MNKFGKYLLLVTGFALLATLARIPGVTNNVHAHDRSCSVASLKGKYAFRRMGVNNLGGGSNCTGFNDCGPIAEMGVAVYGGDGKRGNIRNTRSTAGEIRPWTDQPAPNGTYTVDPDCTGEFFDEDGTHSNNVVVVDGGKRFFVLSEAPGTTVMEEGIRLEEDKD